MEQRLGKSDWVHAALRSLASHGIEAVRVERLSKDLGVTKGSFYWHFKDRNDLLATMLEAWKDRATLDIIAMVEAAGGNARERLHTLGRTVFSADGRLDQRIRGWAASDPAAREAQDGVDSRRLAYLEQLLLELGLSSRDATARAKLLYHALIGQFTAGPSARPSSEQLTIILNLVTSLP
jgi:AcrR family transcriptional regulator